MICGPVHRRRSPPSSPVRFVPRPWVGVRWLEDPTRWWQQERRATWPWRGLMRHTWKMRSQNCGGESQKGGLPNTSSHRLVSSERSQGDTPVHESRLTYIRNTGADGDVAAVQSHFWRLGLPLLPVRKDICQAVALSPVGFRSKESIQEINDIILICSRIITRVFKTDSLNISAKEKSIF